MLSLQLALVRDEQPLILSEIKPGAKYGSPSPRLDKNPAIFDQTEWISLGLVGRIRIRPLARSRPRSSGL